MPLFKGKYYHYFIRAVLSIVLVITFFAHTFGQDVSYKAQSLYIYKFTHYINWPNDNADTEFVIGVYGNSPISDELAIMAKFKKAGQGQKIVIRQLNNIQQLSNEKIIYIASSKSRELRSILQMVENKPILLVAEREGLAKKGASINFMLMENNFLRFEINTKNIKQRNLSISDELLKRGYEVH